MIARTAAAVALLTALVLGGCGGSDAGPDAQSRPRPTATAPDVPAAQGKLVSTIEYSYRAPRGWVDSPEGSDPQSGSTDQFDSQVWLGDAQEGVLTDGVSVLRIGSAFSDDPDDIEKASVDSLRSEGVVKEIKILPRREVAGVQVTGLRGLRKPTSGGDALPLLQFALVHNELTYIVSFAYSTIDDTGVQEEIAQSVLASWKWAS